MKKKLIAIGVALTLASGCVPDAEVVGAIEGEGRDA